MSGAADSVSLREMTAADVPVVVGVQRAGAVVGLADVFPQDAYPFPSDVVRRRWLEEIAAPEIDCLAVLHRDVVVGFAALRQDELLHFGIAIDLWGTGTAQAAHDLLLDRMRCRGARSAWLRVFIENSRGRRFYEKLGWRDTGERSRSTFPPYAELMQYRCDLTKP